MEILGCVGLIVVLVAASVLNGWALSVMWGWFIVPTLGAPALSVPAAIGLGIIASFLTTRGLNNSARANKGQELVVLISELFYAIFYPLCSLAIGYIVHLFM